ncbi:uncharacterized protein LOC131145790 [Malania oleifera]|uniref:uncharacterized protein LOC131145790 n=1 Tax=Malania oleifera TaxID=397392 RepID=UPI0025AEAAE3|nr:uncharacterized protein LOC131145790 [Malania oleifera]
MAEIARSSMEQGSPSVVQGCTIEKFTKMNPLAFSRETDPAIVKNWMQKINKILTVLHYINEMRVLYATYKLTGEAERWWMATRLLEVQRPIPVAMTWSRFREVFLDKYFLATVGEAKVVEFLNLSQENLRVQQYAAKFIEVSRFVPYVVPDEVKKARMFERGLKR